MIGIAGGNGKVRLAHHCRRAIVYVRQSTARQVKANEESAIRQRGLRESVVALGWPAESVEVIDDDLGISGKFADNRPGFQRLVSEVAVGNVGVVACIEASRLSRSGSDWGRIIELCAITDTLIMDEDAIYDANDPNDRLLLGVKGSISEMELHNIRARMHGGMVSKVSRGEMRIPLPVGYVYDPLGRIAMDPDEAVRSAVSALFSTFEAKGSVYATVRHFREHGITFPHQVRTGPMRGTVEWEELTDARALFVLRHPMYCGRYVYGRTKTTQTPSGRSLSPRGEGEMLADIHDHHPAYISEEQFAANAARLSANARHPAEDDPSLPGRGSALLQGIVYCGKCGRRMQTTYQASTAKGGRAAFPVYICDGGRHTSGHTHTRCTQVNGTAVDEMVSGLAASRLTDVAAAEAAAARLEVQRRWDESERLLELQVQRAEYEADLMRRRYLACDPANALVRVEVERCYNEALAAVAAARDALGAERARHAPETEAEVLARLDNLEEEFSEVWNDPASDPLSKKRLLQTVIQSVTLTREKGSSHCLVQVLYSGGGTEEIDVRCTFYGPNTVSWRVRSYLEEHGTELTGTELADQLNSMGLLRTNGDKWTGQSVIQYMSNAGIKNKRQHYAELGWLTTKELAREIGISKTSIDYRRKHGFYDGLCVHVTDHCVMYSPDAVSLGGAVYRLSQAREGAS